jgi:uncharacterized protein DUF1573
MKRELLAVAVFAASTMGVARAQVTNTPAATTNAPTTAPKIQFDKTVYDFGTTSLVDSVMGTFTFQNTGDGDLKMGKPQPSCGCTVASVKPEVLKPGEKGELVFKVNVGAAHGSIEKHITVPSNDPQNPKLSLSIKADIKQILEVTPTQVSLGAIRSGATTNMTVTVHRTDGKKLVISETQPSSKDVKATVEPVQGDAQSAKLTITVTGEGTPRRLSDQVKVFLDGITQPAATVTVFGQVLGDVTISPEQLYWPVTSQASSNSLPVPPPRRITVTSTRADQPLEIKNIATSLTNMTVQIVTIEAGKTYAVVAQLASTPTTSERGTISFDTNTPIQPKVTIPVTITVIK